MKWLPDYHAGKPDVGINETALDVVYVRFGAFKHSDTGESTTAIVAMNTPDAMRLMTSLEVLQEKFALPAPVQRPALKKVRPPSTRH
jgi:hypothetical protein